MTLAGSGGHRPREEPRRRLTSGAQRIKAGINLTLYAALHVLPVLMLTHATQAYALWPAGAAVAAVAIALLAMGGRAMRSPTSGSASRNAVSLSAAHRAHWRFRAGAAGASRGRRTPPGPTWRGSAPPSR